MKFQFFDGGEIMVGTDDTGGGPEEYPAYGTYNGDLILELDYEKGQFLVVYGSPTAFLVNAHLGMNDPRVWVEGKVPDDVARAVAATRHFIFGDEYEYAGDAVHADY